MDAFKDRHNSKPLTDSASADWAPPEGDAHSDETWRQLFAVSQAELRDARAAMEASRRISDERQSQLERLTQRNHELRGEVAELHGALTAARNDSARDFAHLRELESEFKEQRNLLEQHLAQREAEVQNLKNRYFSEIQTLKTQQTTELVTTTKQLVADAENQRERHALELESLRSRHSMEIEGLKQRRVSDIEELKQRQTADINELNGRHASKIAALTEQFSAEIAALKKSLSFEANRTAEISDELNAAQAQIARKESEIETLKEIAGAAIADADRHETTVAVSAQANQAELNEMRETIEKLKAEHARELEDRIRAGLAAQWIPCAEQLRRYSDMVNQEKAALRKVADRLAEELRQALVLHPLRDYLGMTEKELSKTELQLRKTPTSSLNRPRLETHLTDLTEQRDYLRSVIENSQRQIAIQTEQVRNLARDSGLKMAPPPPPRIPPSSKA